jgi:hypothetical protein
MVPVFYHSGEIGDLLYGLKVIQHIGKGDLYTNADLLIDFNPDTELCVFPNKWFDQRTYNFVKRLVYRQPYINKFEFDLPPHIDYNLNYFRKMVFDTFDVNFYELYYRICNVTPDEPDGYKPWIECDAKSIAPITVIRTTGAGRTIPNYPWKTIVDKYKNQMVFLGTKHEYDVFTRDVGGKKIKWYESSDMLSICEVINGAQLHIGNSTSITVCAEALKKNLIFEESSVRKNNKYVQYHEFGRTNRFNVYADEVNVDAIMEKIELFTS